MKEDSTQPAIPTTEPAPVAPVPPDAIVHAPRLTPTAEDGISYSGPWEVDLTGKALGDFHILRRLGHGGMGQVYVAEQISLKRKVALKLLRADLAVNGRALARFTQEAKAVARATHANIVQVYAIGEAEGIHYMALEYVEGRNLREHLEKKGLPPLPEALSIVTQVAAALQKASELGIVHRDIKPENILITREMEVKVADFGLSRIFDDEGRRPQNLTESGVTMGTPLYMSPEQVEGKTVDPRSDIYSFGATCYHMFAGHPPFRGQAPFEVALQHVQKEPQPLAEIRPDLPLEVCGMIHKMMAKRPQDRFQTARDILREVCRLRNTLGISGEFPGTLVSLGPSPSGPVDAVPTQSMPMLRLARWLPWVGAIAVVLALVGGAAVGWLRQRETAVEPDDSAFVKEPVENKKASEEFLIKGVQRYANPGPREVAAGLKFASDLGVLYLKDRRLKDADNFFKSLAQPEQKVKDYRYFGKLGEAMVLAFRDNPRESNDFFARLLLHERAPGEKTAGAGRQFWYSIPQFREMTAEALHHNYVNAPEAFPRALEPWLHPPTTSPKAGRP